MGLSECKGVDLITNGPYGSKKVVSHASFKRNLCCMQTRPKENNSVMHESNAISQNSSNK